MIAVSEKQLELITWMMMNFIDTVNLAIRSGIGHRICGICPARDECDHKKRCCEEVFSLMLNGDVIEAADIQ